ncbi:unnamed protein product, partial [Musa hybrid cultivar]
MINRGHLTTVARLSLWLKLQQSKPSIDAGGANYIFLLTSTCRQRERIRTARPGQTCRARDRVEDDCSSPPSRHSRGAITVAILPLAEASPFPFLCRALAIPSPSCGPRRERQRERPEEERGPPVRLPLFFLLR